MLKLLHNYVHNTTAKICQDIAQPSEVLELKEPNPIRRWARLVAIAVAGGLLLAGIVVMAMHIPKLQSEKKVVSTNSTDEVAKLLQNAVEHKQSVNCPCQNQGMSWCDVTTFHLIRAAYKGASNFSVVLNFTKEEGGNNISLLCKGPTAPLKSTICQHLLTPFLNKEDSRTFLPSANAFARPELLYWEIASRIDTNAYEQSNAFFFLSDMHTPTESEAFNYSQGLTKLIRQMQFQFLTNYSSSIEDYWNAAAEIRRNFSMSSTYGMHVSWDVYLQTCKPAFCDVEYEISYLNRALRAMGQVGGIATIFTLLLRFIVWPSVRFVLCFPTAK